MSNWKAITETLVRSEKHTALLDAMQSLATSRGEDDPLPAIITRAIGRVQSAVAAANDLDTDATKIPSSLEWLAMNLITRGIKGYLEIELSDAEKQQQRSDDSYLNDMVRLKLRFAAPDNPAGGGQLQAQAGISTVDPAEGRRFTRDKMGGL